MIPVHKWKNEKTRPAGKSSCEETRLFKTGGSTGGA